MTKRRKLEEIYKYCVDKYTDYRKIKKEDLLRIMYFIDKKKTERILDEQQDDYNGLLKG